MRRFFFLIILFLTIASCKEVYQDPPQAMVLANFFNANDGKSISSNITVQGIGIETTWVKDTLLPRIILPLSPAQETKFAISFDSTIDTITFFHETSLKYESMETGFYYDFIIKSVESTKHRIVDIQIIDSLVTIDWHENIKLFLLPKSAGN
jgi:hypothetical protein